MGVYRCMGSYRHRGHTNVWGFTGMGCMDLGCMGCTDIWGNMDIWRAYGYTCLPGTSEGICKKFSFPLIMSHVHYLNTEMINNTKGLLTAVPD